MKWQVNSTYGKSSVVSLAVHSLLIAVFLAMPPAEPAERAKNLAEVEILPIPPAPERPVVPRRPEEPAQTPPPEARPEMQNQPLSSEPSLEAEPAPQAEALPGEAQMPNTVGLRSGKGSGIPRVTGIPPVRAGQAGAGSGSVTATAVYAPKPAYPPAAKKDGWEGTIVLKIQINTDGSVTVLSVLEGERDDAKDAAVQVVSTWQYSPDRNARGIPVSSVRNIRVNFDLKDAV